MPTREKPQAKKLLKKEQEQRVKLDEATGVIMQLDYQQFLQTLQKDREEMEHHKSRTKKKDISTAAVDGHRGENHHLTPLPNKSSPTPSTQQEDKSIEGKQNKNVAAITHMGILRMLEIHEEGKKASEVQKLRNYHRDHPAHQSAMGTAHAFDADVEAERVKIAKQLTREENERLRNARRKKEEAQERKEKLEEDARQQREQENRRLGLMFRSPTILGSPRMAQKMLDFARGGDIPEEAYDDTDVVLLKHQSMGSNRHEDLLQRRAHSALDGAVTSNSHDVDGTGSPQLTRYGTLKTSEGVNKRGMTFSVLKSGSGGLRHTNSQDDVGYFGQTETSTILPPIGATAKDMESYAPPPALRCIAGDGHHSPTIGSSDESTTSSFGQHTLSFTGTTSASSPKSTLRMPKRDFREGSVDSTSTASSSTLKIITHRDSLLPAASRLTLEETAIMQQLQEMKAQRTGNKGTNNNQEKSTTNSSDELHEMSSFGNQVFSFVGSPSSTMRRQQDNANVRVRRDNRSSFIRGLGEQVSSPKHSNSTVRFRTPSKSGDSKAEDDNFDKKKWVAQQMKTTQSSDMFEQKTTSMHDIDVAVGKLNKDEILLASREHHELVEDLRQMVKERTEEEIQQSKRRKIREKMMEEGGADGGGTLTPGRRLSLDGNDDDVAAGGETIAKRRFREQLQAKRERGFNRASSPPRGALSETIMLEEGTMKRRTHLLHSEHMTIEKQKREQEEAEARELKRLQEEERKRREEEGEDMSIHEEADGSTAAPSSLTTPQNLNKPTSSDDFEISNADDLVSDDTWAFSDNPGGAVFDIRQTVPSTTEFMEVFGVGRSRHLAQHRERDVARRAFNHQGSTLFSPTMGSTAADKRHFGFFGSEDASPKSGVFSSNDGGGSSTTEIMSPKRIGKMSPQFLGANSPKLLKNVTTDPFSPKALQANNNFQKPRALSGINLEIPAGSSKTPSHSTSPSTLSLNPKSSSKKKKGSAKKQQPAVEEAPLFTLCFDDTGRQVTEIECDEQTGLPVKMVRFGGNQKDYTAKRRFLRKMNLQRRKQFLMATTEQHHLEEQLANEAAHAPIEHYMEVFFTPAEHRKANAGNLMVQTAVVSSEKLAVAGVKLPPKAAAVTEFGSDGKIVPTTGAVTNNVPTKDAEKKAGAGNNTQQKLPSRASLMAKDKVLHASNFADTHITAQDCEVLMGKQHAALVDIEIHRPHLGQREEEGGRSRSASIVSATPSMSRKNSVSSMGAFAPNSMKDIVNNLLQDARPTFIRVGGKPGTNADQCQKAAQWLFTALNTGSHPAVIRTRFSDKYEPEQVAISESPRRLQNEEDWYEIDEQMMLKGRQEHDADQAIAQRRRRDSTRPAAVGNATGSAVAALGGGEYKFKANKAAFGGAVLRQQQEKLAQWENHELEEGEELSSDEEDEPEEVPESSTSSEEEDTGEYIPPTQAERLEHLFRLNNVQLRPEKIEVFIHDEHHEKAKSCATCVFARPIYFCSGCGYVSCKTCSNYIHRHHNKDATPTSRRESLSFPLDDEPGDEPHKLELLSDLAKVAANERFQAALQQKREEERQRQLEEQQEREEAARRNQHVAFRLMVEQQSAGGSVDVNRLDPHVAEAYKYISKQLEKGESVEGLDLTSLGGINAAMKGFSARTNESSDNRSYSQMGSSARTDSSGVPYNMSDDDDGVSSARKITSSERAARRKGNRDGQRTSDSKLPRSSSVLSDTAKLRTKAKSIAAMRRKSRKPRSDSLSGDDSSKSKLSPIGSSVSGSAAENLLSLPEVMIDPFELWKQTKRKAGEENDDHKFALIVSISSFSDLAIAPLPVADTVAQQLAARLAELGFDTDIMSNEVSKSQPFMQPTLANISTNISILSAAITKRMQSVLVIVLTRGVVGMLSDIADTTGRQYIAATEDTAISRIDSKSCILPKEFISEHKDQFGNSPFLIVDAWPLASVPFAMDQPGCGFGAMVARPGSSGSELYAGYGKHTGGLMSYYLVRALQGRAVTRFPGDEPATPEQGRARSHIKVPGTNIQMPKSILLNSPGMPAGLTSSSSSTSVESKGQAPTATPVELHKFLSTRLKRKHCNIVSDLKEDLEDNDAEKDGDQQDGTSLIPLPGSSRRSTLNGSTKSPKDSSDSLTENPLLTKKYSQKMTEKEAREQRMAEEAAAKQREKESNAGYPLLVFPHTLTEASIKLAKKNENLKFNRRIHVHLLVRQGPNVMPVRYTRNEEEWKKYLDYTVRKAVAGSRFVPPNPNVGALSSMSSSMVGGFTFSPNGDVSGTTTPAPRQTPPPAPSGGGGGGGGSNAGSRPPSNAGSKREYQDSKKKSTASFVETASLAAAAARRKKREAMAKLDHIQLLFTREHPTKAVLEFQDMHHIVKDSGAKGKLEKGIWNTFAEVRKRTETDRYCFFRNHMASAITEVDAPTAEAKQSLMDLIDDPQLNPTRPKSVLVPVTATFIGSLRDFRRLEKAACTQPFFMNAVLVDCQLDPHKESKHIAATKFQALFRRFLVRRYIDSVNKIVAKEHKYRGLQENRANAFMQSVWKEHKTTMVTLLCEDESFKRHIILDWEAKDRRAKADIPRVELQAREMLTRRMFTEMEEQMREAHIETLYRNMLLDWANFEYTMIIHLHRTWFRCHWTRFYCALERHQEYLTIRASARKHIPNISAAPTLEAPPTDFDFASSLVTLPRNIRSMRQTMQQMFDNTAMDRMDLAAQVDDAMPQSPRTARR